MEPVFFETPAAFRAWLTKNHRSATELWVGFHKVGSGRTSIRWPEAVAEALCFGWIDGVRRRVDDDSYANRFTPRRAGSNWSAVNVARARELVDAGRMRPAGLAAFEARSSAKTGVFPYEQRKQARLEPEHERTFKRNRKAWTFFQAQPPGYRQTATWWVASATRPETRAKRLATLIEDSARGRRIAQLARPGGTAT